MECLKCKRILTIGDNFCRECGFDQSNKETVIGTPEIKRKSFRLDTSKDANRRGLMGIGFIILLRFLGGLIGSYMLAGLILGILFAILDYYSQKKS